MARNLIMCELGTNERGEDFRFTLETSESFGISGHQGRQHLDRHGSLQIRVGGFVDFTIPPTPMSAVISYTPSRVPGVRAKRLKV